MLNPFIFTQKHALCVKYQSDSLRSQCLLFTPACDCHHVLSHPSSGGTFTTLALRVLYSARDPLAVLNQGALVSIGGVVMVQVRASWQMRSQRVDGRFKMDKIT